MNIDSKSTIAYMCSDCGDFSIFDLNVFNFSGNRIKTLDCLCKKSQLKIAKNTNKTFKIDMKCPVCNENHSFSISQSHFWSGSIFVFSCSSYEANILFVGETKEVESAVESYLNEELLDTVNNESFPSYELFSKVSEIIKNSNKIKICKCINNEYKIAYNDSELYIICPQCNKSFGIPYTNLEDFISKPEVYLNNI